MSREGVSVFYWWFETVKKIPDVRMTDKDGCVRSYRERKICRSRVVSVFPETSSRVKGHRCLTR